MNPTNDAWFTTKTNYGLHLDLAGWTYNQKATDVTIAQLTGSLSTATQKSEYLKKDIAFRSFRAAISRQLAYTQLLENQTTNSILNYKERLSAVRDLFDIYARKLVTRVLAVQRAAHQLYGIDTALVAPPTGGIVDALAKWLAQMQDQVSKFDRRQKVSVFTIWVASWLQNNGRTFADAISGPHGLQLEIKLRPADTQSQSGLLRGIAFEYLGSGKYPIQLTVRPPISVTGGLNGTHSQPLSLNFGRVLQVAQAPEVRPQHIDLVWNGDPYETWHISDGKQLASNGAQDLAIHLWLANWEAGE